MKLGISIKIDVTKIDKERLFKGEKGTYLDLTTFIDPDNPGDYGDHGFISQDVTKEERADNIQGPILGNCKVFWKEDNPQGAPGNIPEDDLAPQGPGPVDDSIPF